MLLSSMIIHFIITIATKSMNTNTNNGFLPSQIKGRVIIFTILFTAEYFCGNISTKITNKNIVSPLVQLVNMEKLLEYNFLFNGIILVRGYTHIPKIKLIIPQYFNVLLSYPLFSFIIKQK